MKGKLNQTQIASLPDLLKEQTQTEIAKLWNVRPQNISYWVKQYKKRGIDLPRKKAETTLDKILKNYNATDPNLQTGQETTN